MPWDPAWEILTLQKALFKTSQKRGGIEPGVEGEKGRILWAGELRCRKRYGVRSSEKSGCMGKWKTRLKDHFVLICINTD